MSSVNCDGLRHLLDNGAISRKKDGPERYQWAKTFQTLQKPHFEIMWWHRKSSTGCNKCGNAYQLWQVSYDGAKHCTPPTAMMCLGNISTICGPDLPSGTGNCCNIQSSKQSVVSLPKFKEKQGSNVTKGNVCNLSNYTMTYPWCCFRQPPERSEKIVKVFSWFFISFCKHT